MILKYTDANLKLTLIDMTLTSHICHHDMITQDFLLLVRALIPWEEEG